MNGVFITFEGPDASGKTTQIRLLEEALRKEKFEPLLTREPGGTRIGERIREILLDRDSAEMTPVAEMLLYAAARAQHVEQVIRPALEEGRVVISDRYTDSSIAYQGYGRGLGDVVARVNAVASGNLQPDLTFLLITTPENMRQRVAPSQEDRMESEKNEFHQRVLEGFLELQKNEPGRIVALDGNQSIEGLAEQIREKAIEVIRSRDE